jgi:hypothetical protein
VIEARHVTCAYPTCNRRSGRCDLDHVRHERGEEFDVGRAS